MKCLNEDAYKKEEKDRSCTLRGRDDHIATSAKLLDIRHDSYRISGDLIETIN